MTDCNLWINVLTFLHVFTALSKEHKSWKWHFLKLWWNYNTGPTFFAVLQNAECCKEWLITAGALVCKVNWYSQHCILQGWENQLVWDGKKQDFWDFHQNYRKNTAHFEKKNYKRSFIFCASQVLKKLIFLYAQFCIFQWMDSCCCKDLTEKLR